MGITEYWLVGFRALGAVRHIGQPKQPTITICQLEGDEYQMRRFVAGETLVSGIFPQLSLTTDAIFAAAGWPQPILTTPHLTGWLTNLCV